MSYLSVFPRSLVGPDSPTVKHIINKTVIGNFAPETPLVGAGSNVTSIGSCFAEEIAKILTRNLLPTTYLRMTETSNSAFALDLYLSHFLGDKPLPPNMMGDSHLDTLNPQDARDAIKKSKVMIMTLGMSLLWFDRDGIFVVDPTKTGMDKYPGLAAEHAPPQFQMRQTTVEENEVMIQRCVGHIRTVRPDVPVVLTLSPVPLMGTRYDMPAVPANAISKATLRCAIDGVMRKNLPNVYYWPSYEIVTWFGNHVERAFGDEEIDARHVRKKVIDLIGELFVSHYVG